MGTLLHVLPTKFGVAAHDCCFCFVSIVYIMDGCRYGVFFDMVDAVYENTMRPEGQQSFTLVPLATMAVVTFVGLAVHSKEPGIFAKDKRAKKQ